MFSFLTANTALRVDWSRAKARKNRWDEEVDLLREEMRRELRYLLWEKTSWDNLRSRAGERSDNPLDIRGGLQS